MTREANNAAAIAKVFGFMQRPLEPAKLISSFWRGRTRVGWTMGAAVEEGFYSRKSLGEAAVPATLARRVLTTMVHNGRAGCPAGRGCLPVFQSHSPILPFTGCNFRLI